MPSGVEPKGRVLLVEDDDACRVTLQALLEAEFDITAVSSFAMALQMLRLGSFEVVVTDYELRDGLGLRLLEIAIDPHLVGILVTGQIDAPEVLEASRGLNVFRVALKPYDPEILVGWVRSAILLSRGRRSGRMRKVTLKV